MEFPNRGASETFVLRHLHEAFLLDPQKVLCLEVAEISLELHTVELGHLIDGTETKTGKSEGEINF